MIYATFSRRLGAFLLDVVPITLFIATLFYFTTDFDDRLHQYLERGPHDHESRAAFLEVRNRIRLISGLAYVLYASVLHATAWQATVGKKLVGIQVVDGDGGRVPFGVALLRSCGLMLSILPAFIGCLAVIWSKKKQAWHDRMVGTFVVVTGMSHRRDVPLTHAPLHDRGPESQWHRIWAAAAALPGIALITLGVFLATLFLMTEEANGFADWLVELLPVVGVFLIPGILCTVAAVTFGRRQYRRGAIFCAVGITLIAFTIAVYAALDAAAQ